MRTTPVTPARSPRQQPPQPQPKQRPLIYLICAVNSCRAENPHIRYAWLHLQHLWDTGKIDDPLAWQAITDGPGKWSDIINELHSPYKEKTGGICI